MKPRGRQRNKWERKLPEYKEKEMIYLAYGSNMNTLQMRYRCPRAKVLGTAMLENYRLVFRGNSRGCGVANIERRKGYKVPVVLWEITEDCEERLDIYEGFPHLYIKKRIIVDFKGEQVNAMVYIMREARPFTEPNPSYFYTIYTAYKKFGFDLEPLKG